MLKYVEQHRGVIIAGEIKILALEIRLQNILFFDPDLAKFFSMDDRIYHRPSPNIWLNGRRMNELKELCLVHADLDQIDRSGATR